LLNKLKENPKNYILKPNKEGGDNNLFGIDALNKLITLDKESRKAYILM
jgi:glutathione synthase